jgi:hypothetical protein
MADVMEAIPVGAVEIFPGFAPGNGGEDENQRRIQAEGGDEISGAALLHGVRRGPIVEEAAAGGKVKFRGMEIARGGVHAQGVAIAGGFHLPGGADGRGIEEELGKKIDAGGGGGPFGSAQNFERGNGGADRGRRADRLRERPRNGGRDRADWTNRGYGGWREVSPEYV